MSLPRDNPFTCYYAQLSHQVRTGTYQKAFLNNKLNFTDKVVLDVGAGTGILSFFAAQAGARKVYAVEASNSAEVARQLAEVNGYSHIVEVIQGKLEEIDLPERVDIIISEPIGFLLVHERMIESYVTARDRFLKPDGLMMPTNGSIVFSPMTDDYLYMEQVNKGQLWTNRDFFGIDLTSLIEKAKVENLSQPIVGFFPLQSLISNSRTVHLVDFSTVTCQELQQFEIPYRFRIDRTAIMHGFGCWFDISFLGSEETIILSTSPEHPGTHWYQCRLLLNEPLAVNKGQYVSGKMEFFANDRFSYNIFITVQLEGTEIQTSSTIYLHDQCYHYLHAGTAAPVEGSGY